MQCRGFLCSTRCGTPAPFPCGCSKDALCQRAGLSPISRQDQGAARSHPRARSVTARSCPLTLPLSLSPQELVGEAPPALVEPLLALLGSAHLEVQHQGRTGPGRPGVAQRGRGARGI